LCALSELIWVLESWSWIDFHIMVIVPVTGENPGQDQDLCAGKELWQLELFHDFLVGHHPSLHIHINVVIAMRAKRLHFSRDVFRSFLYFKNLLKNVTSISRTFDLIDNLLRFFSIKHADASFLQNEQNSEDTQGKRKKNQAKD